jgi:hypothetical protein
MIEIFSKKKVGCVLHDAGAANHVLARLKKLKNIDIKFVAKGPALKLINFFFPKHLIYKDVNLIIDEIDYLIAGTGWASDFEYNALGLAVKKKIYSISAIDHWVNYRERFSRNSKVIYPNEIWTFDNFAKNLASITFPAVKVTKHPNYYLKEAIEAIKKNERALKKNRGNHVNILYVLEPIRDSWGKSVIKAEFIALNFFLKNIAYLKLGKNFELKLRPHPSDSTQKYNSWIKKQKNIFISLDFNSSLEDSIAWSDYVIGCNSYALVIAKFAGKKVYSSLPEAAPNLTIPYKGIKEIRKLII